MTKARVTFQFSLCTWLFLEGWADLGSQWHSSHNHLHVKYRFIEELDPAFCNYKSGKYAGLALCVARHKFCSKQGELNYAFNVEPKSTKLDLILNVQAVVKLFCVGGWMSILGEITGEVYIWILWYVLIKVNVQLFYLFYFVISQMLINQLVW